MEGEREREREREKERKREREREKRERGKKMIRNQMRILNCSFFFFFLCLCGEKSEKKQKVRTDLLHGFRVASPDAVVAGCVSIRQSDPFVDSPFVQ